MTRELGQSGPGPVPGGQITAKMNSCSCALLLLLIAFFCIVVVVLPSLN